MASPPEWFVARAAAALRVATAPAPASVADFRNVLRVTASEDSCLMLKPAERACPCFPLPSASLSLHPTVHRVGNRAPNAPRDCRTSVKFYRAHTGHRPQAV